MTRRFLTAHPKRIGIVRLSAVGDVVMAMPAVAALRRTFPDAHLTWIAERAAAPLLHAAPFVDDVIVFPKHTWRVHWERSFGYLRSAPDVARFFRDLGRLDFDVVVDFQGNLKSAACTFATRAPLRLGYGRRDCQEPNWLGTTRRLSLQGAALHRIDRDLLLVSTLGVEPHFHPVSLRYAAEDRAACPEMTTSSVLLQPGTSAFMPHKRWSPLSYADLAKRLARHGLDPWVGFGPGEEALRDLVVDRSDGDARPLPLLPSMSAVGYAATQAALVIGGDTGPVHLAAVQGTPTVIVLGPTDPRLYYPYGHPERAIFRRPPCAPCRNRHCPTRICLDDVSVERVETTALEALER